MRAAKIILVVWVLCELALWIRGGQNFSVIDTLPFAERTERFSPDYEWLALAAILIGVWGFVMMPPGKPSNQQSQTGGRFRSDIILAPLTIIGLAMLSRRLHSRLRFAEMVGDPARLTEHQHLAVLCVIVFAILIAIKALRNRS